MRRLTYDGMFSYTRIRQLSEASTALAHSPKHIAVLRMLRIKGRPGCTNG